MTYPLVFHDETSNLCPIRPPAIYQTTVFGMQHQKHNKLAKPGVGQFGRNEWAILGAPCSTIQQLAQALRTQFGSNFRIAYADADHQSGDNGAAAPVFPLQYTDKINFQRLDLAEQPNVWQQRALFNDADLVLVNGNHFTATRQIVLLDKRKFDSLQRKTERLTQVDLFVTHAGDEHYGQPSELPESVRQQIPNWAALPVFDLNQHANIAAFLDSKLTKPPLHALILTGGKSTRMGSDKAELDYHGIPQWQYLKRLLHTSGITDIFLSCRAEQMQAFASEAVIADTFLGLGPMGAILSAFQHNPDAAWLVVACDLPLLDAGTIRHLIAHRQPSACATAFRQTAPPPGWFATKAAKDTGFPEPLITIWEPKSYQHLLQFLAQGVSCPRKVLINSPAHLLDAPNPEALLNVNTPEERALILEKLQTQAV